MRVAGPNQPDIDAQKAELFGGQARDFIALLKPRVMSLVLFTAFVGLMVANALNPGLITPIKSAIAMFCIAVAAGAAGSLNMWYDADIDGRMTRTADRPVPSGRVSAHQALVFGLILSVGSVALMAIAINLLSAGLLALTIFFYAVIYTIWLKRRTAQNIVIGGAAGSFPPMVAWAAVTNSVTIESIVLFLIIFIWTPPHFWSLALLISDEYKKVGVPMLPVVASETVTRGQILLYTILMIPIGMAPAILGFAGMAYGAMSIILGALFLISAIRVFYIREGKPARAAAWHMFAFSIVYLFALYATLLLEHLLGATLLPNLTL